MKLKIFSVLIPIWCNWKIRLYGDRPRIHSVLIPIWCNWKAAYLGGVTRAAYRFNSYMVQLEAEMKEKTFIDYLRFNSYMVQLED